MPPEYFSTVTSALSAFWKTNTYAGDDPIRLPNYIMAKDAGCATGLPGHRGQDIVITYYKDFRK